MTLYHVYKLSLAKKIFVDLPEVSTPNPAVSVSFGERAILTCNVKATPVYDLVYWELKDSFATRRIFTGTVGTEGSTVNNSTLILKYATDTVSGLYTCFARNALGISKSSSINLTVKGGKKTKATFFKLKKDFI